MMVSIGVVVCEDVMSSLDVLVKVVDQGVYQVKVEGCDCYVVI